jgi:hypothetical protein
MTPVQMELEMLREENGGILRAEDVVAYAANPESALHRHFQWDDERAALEHRLAQARKLIRLHVTIIPRTANTVRTYVSLQDDRRLPGGGYRHLATVMGDAEQRQALLAEALREARRWQARYQHLSEFAEVFAELDAVEAVALINSGTLDLALEEATP